MRRAILLIFFLILLFPALAGARTTDRCWLSLGFTAGPAIFTDPEMKNEFNIPAQFEIEAKYYLWKPFSLAGAFGYLYGEGRPTKIEWKNQWSRLDSRGISFWRGYTFGALLRAEIGRYWTFNPYLGGGVYGAYNSLERSGKLNSERVSDSYGEYLLQYPTLIGFDVLLNKVIAIRTEARWTFMPTHDKFTDEKRFDYWSGQVGLQLYF